MRTITPELTNNLTESTGLARAYHRMILALDEPAIKTPTPANFGQSAETGAFSHSTEPAEHTCILGAPAMPVNGQPFAHN